MGKAVVIVLIGPPASGKGTQSKLLISKYNIPHISTGDLVREQAALQTAKGEKLRECIKAGKFPPDKFIISLLIDRLTAGDCKKGFILDGFPRTKKQGKLFEKHCKLLNVEPIVIKIDVPDEDVINRVVNRIVCQSCYTPYHLKFSPPKQEGICDMCGGALAKRDDDSREVMQERLKLYYEKTEPLFKFFEKKGWLTVVDGTLDKEGIFKRLSQIIEEKGDVAC
ncbi:MAG: adenylate kinase [Chlamydiales bacterium]|nr:adenylate kinase [Chlamydiales bacterium]MCH9620273.1 adenylate kinase [Chlamydiales bacterium]MCH9622816.1 adenylate kinase [Chlamydiales bacterium]